MATAELHQEGNTERIKAWRFAQGQANGMDFSLASGHPLQLTVQPVNQASVAATRQLGVDLAAPAQHLAHLAAKAAQQTVCGAAVRGA